MYHGLLCLILKSQNGAVAICKRDFTEKWYPHDIRDGYDHESDTIVDALDGFIPSDAI